MKHSSVRGVSWLVFFLNVKSHAFLRTAILVSSRFFFSVRRSRPCCNRSRLAKEHGKSFSQSDLSGQPASDSCGLAALRGDHFPGDGVKRFFVCVLGYFIMLTLGPASTLRADSLPADPSRPMNVIIVLIDDLGWRDTEITGSRYYRTPHINRLAAEGMRFTRGYAAAAVCSPSRAAIMTGKAPARLHITDWIPGGKVPPGSRFTVPDWNLQLDHEELTLAEALKERGYATASIGKWHLGGKEKSGESYLPETQGFDFPLAGGHMEKPSSYFWPSGKKEYSRS